MATELSLLVTSLKSLVLGVKVVTVHSVQVAIVRLCQMVTVWLTSQTFLKSLANGVQIVLYTVAVATAMVLVQLLHLMLVQQMVARTSVITLIVQLALV
jgi:hypothetical protein